MQIKLLNKDRKFFGKTFKNNMNKSTVAFIGGVYAGFLLTASLMFIFVVDPIKKEAIKLGYAEMKISTPYDTKSVFTWKETK